MDIITAAEPKRSYRMRVCYRTSLDVQKSRTVEVMARDAQEAHVAAAAKVARRGRTIDGSVMVGRSI